MDPLTQILNRALDLLGQTHPIRLTIGILIGAVCHTFSQAFEKVMPHQVLVDLAASVGLYGWLAAGVLIAAAPLVLRKDGVVRERDRMYLALLGKVIKEGDLSRADKVSIHRRVVEKVLDSYNPTDQSGAQIQVAATEPPQESSG